MFHGRYSEMRNAAAERGNYLDDLGESLNNVSVSASSYLSQAKNAAVSFDVSSIWLFKSKVECLLLRLVLPAKLSFSSSLVLNSMRG